MKQNADKTARASPEIRGGEGGKGGEEKKKKTMVVLASISIRITATECVVNKA